MNLREVPPGTNGGVTATGLGAGLLGSFIVSATSAAVLPFCASAGLKDRALWTIAMTLWGTLGSVLDSVLGGLLQASVVDKRSGKVVEGSGGRKVSSRLCVLDHSVQTSNLFSRLSFTLRRASRLLLLIALPKLPVAYIMLQCMAPR